MGAVPEFRALPAPGHLGTGRRTGRPGGTEQNTGLHPSAPFHCFLGSGGGAASSGSGTSISVCMLSQHLVSEAPGTQSHEGRPEPAASHLGHTGSTQGCREGGRWLSQEPVGPGRIMGIGFLSHQSIMLAPGVLPWSWSITLE